MLSGTNTCKYFGQTMKQPSITNNARMKVKISPAAFLRTDGGLVPDVQKIDSRSVFWTSAINRQIQIMEQNMKLKSIIRCKKLFVIHFRATALIVKYQINECSITILRP